MAEKRIINLTEATELSGGDYLVVDSASSGTRKVSGSVINSAIGEVASDLDTLSARVDQIIAPSGEAPSAAEVSDARVGADGVTYTTLGGAIRTQVTDLKSEINYFNAELEMGALANGNDSPSTSAVRSKGYVFVAKGTRIETKKYESKNFVTTVCCYDEDHNFLVGRNISLNTSSTASAIIGDGVSYIRYFTWVVSGVIDSVTSEFLEAFKNNISVYVAPEIQENRNSINYLESLRVTPQQFGAVGDGVTDDTQAFADFIDYIESNNCSMFVPKKTYVADITFSVSSRKYDFGGATILGEITFESNCTNVTISNLEVQFLHDYCMYANQNVYSITFENCRFAGADTDTEQLHFEKNTWAFKFVNCSFIGGASKAYCVFNGALEANQQNDIVSNTMLFVACHFYNFESIKRQEILASSSISIVGGYIDEIDYVVYADSDCAVSLVMSGVDVESTGCIYYAVGYSNSTVALNACYGTPGKIAYSGRGYVNINIAGMRWLTNHPIVDDYCLDPTNNVYVSITGAKHFKATEYRLKASNITYGLSVYIPPQSTVKLLDKVYIINLNRGNSDGLEYYGETGALNQGSSYYYNKLTSIIVKNTLDTPKYATFTITTPCIIY